MSGQTSARMIEAMKLVLARVVPYTAAQRAGIDCSTLYRHRWYKKFRDCGGNPAVIAEIRKEMDISRPVAVKPHGKKKPAN